MLDNCRWKCKQVTAYQGDLESNYTLAAMLDSSSHGAVYRKTQENGPKLLVELVP